MGSIIIIIILIVGGIYIWQSKVKNALEQKSIQPENLAPTDEEELNSLEQDLNTVNTNIDVNVDTIN